MTHALPNKAVIMARGLGTRMRRASEHAQLTEEQRRAADSGIKAMITIDRPFLDYVISALADAGFDDICLVVGPEHSVIRDHFDGIAATRVRISYAIQAEPLGTADAVRAAEAFAGGEPLAVLNSDNYYPVEAFRALREVRGAGLAGFNRQAMLEKSNIPADRIAAFALAKADATGHLIDLVEKPTVEQAAALGDDALVSMNLWLFTESIFGAIRSIEKSPRGEYEITDAVRQAMENGEVFTVAPVAAGVLDMSSRDDIAAVTEALRGKAVRL